MKSHTERGERTRPTRSRKAFRYGLLLAACLGAVGAAAGAAQAVGAQAGMDGSAGVAVATDGARALANPGHSDSFDTSFTVHQYGELFAASVRNQAEADAAGCRSADPCRAVSLSFQIVTMAGPDIHLNAVNLSNSHNVRCTGCESLAGAYQFVVSTPAPFTLSAADLRKLAHIHAELNALRTSGESVDDVKAQADALAAQVTAILKAAAASAPSGSTIRPLTQPAGPLVTVHRMFDQG
jgi:hypothetical protein